MRCYKLIVIIILLLTGCASERESLKDRTPEGIYREALSLLRQKEYSEAANGFKDIETLFPYSSLANNGQILAAYCHYKSKNYMDAISLLDTFLRYHPSHEFVAYAMYLKASCLYMQVASVGRDCTNALVAKKAFIELLNKFPNSIYKDDSLKKVLQLDDIIAAHNMMIGRYYQKNKNDLAAIGRYNFVLNYLPHTNAVNEALFRIVECCVSLGLRTEALNAYNALSFEKAKYWKEKANLLIKRFND